MMFYIYFESFLTITTHCYFIVAQNRILFAVSRWQMLEHGNAINIARKCDAKVFEITSINRQCGRFYNNGSKILFSPGIMRHAKR